ncbi:MAG TPA: type III pantothenate kinase [Cyclobacteriaceae bacterium]|nr:type III pantothenate kinase [Cyclobacteriaceae bacterium]
MVLLAIDIGNSDITLGLNRDGAWQHEWRIATNVDKPEIFYGVKIRDYFLDSTEDINKVSHVVLSSVVPDITEKIERVVFSIFRIKPIVLGPDVYRQLPFNVMNPYEIGSDLVANALAAYLKFKSDCIVVDFGTALTFTGVTAEGKIKGVAIAPGIKTAIKSLSQNTAKLFDVPLQIPQNSLGTDTVKAIQAGVMFGYQGMVRHMLQKTKAEMRENCISIATGGLSNVIDYMYADFDHVIPKLTLDGLKHIAEIITEKQAE